MKWFLLALARSPRYKGRSRRKEFWYTWLFLSLFWHIPIAIITNIYDNQTLLETLNYVDISIFVAFYLPLYVRRLHDTNRSGWWMLTIILPIIFSFFDSYRENNKFGKYPKNENGDLNSLLQFYEVGKYKKK